MIQTSEILDTLRMIDREKLDVRTITMGISLFPCVTDDIGALCRRVYDRITRKAEHLVAVVHYGTPEKAQGRDRRTWAHDLQLQVQALRQVSAKAPAHPSAAPIPLPIAK